MKFIVDQPGLSLILVGIVAFFARWPADRIPGVGDILSAVLFLLALFFVLGGAWMAIVGRRGR